MAWTNWGFDGTINEAQWAQMAGLLGNGYVAATATDCAVTAVAGARSVSVAAGTLFGDGVVSVNSAPETVAMTTPVNGQWYVIALRRTWATNTVALVAIAGATTSTTTPTAPPSTLPTLNTNVGVLTDQPIAWAWCNNVNTTVVVFDMRQLPVRTLPPTVSSATVRDAKFTAPVQGMQVWRDDLGAVETYYGLYNASTNPGGRDSAGWYTDTRAMGLVPMKPTSVNIATGSGTANALGLVTFTGATVVTLNDVFTSAYKTYRICIDITANTASTVITGRFANNGTVYSGANYANFIGDFTSGNTTAYTTGSALTSMNIIEAHLTSNAGGTSAELTIINPRDTGRDKLKVITNGTGSNPTSGYAIRRSGFNACYTATAYEGFSIAATAGNISGTIQVFGYND